MTVSAAAQDNARAFIRTHGGAMLLLAFALAARVLFFGAVPGGFNQDEAMAAYEAWSLAQYGADRFGVAYPVYLTAWGFAQMNVLLPYAMVPLIKLFGLSVVTARLPVLVAGLAGLYALYRFADAAYGRPASWAVLAFAAVSPWHIMHSRWALESNMFPHVLMVAMWLLYDGLTRKPCRLYLSMLVFGLSLYAYGIAYFSVPLLLGVTALYLYRNQRLPLKKILACAGVFLLAAWPVFAMIGINYFRLPSLRAGFFTIPYFPDSVRMGDILLFSDAIFPQLWANLQAFLRVALFQEDPAVWNVLPGYGTLYPWAMPFVCVGLYQLAAERKRPGAFFVLAWLTAACATGLMINQVNVTRVNIIFYPLLIAGGLGIAKVVQLPRKLTTIEVQAQINHGRFSIHYVQDDRRAKQMTRAVAAGLAAVLLFSFSGFSNAYFRRYNDGLAYIFFADFYKSLDYVNERPYDRLYVTAWTQYPGFSHTSEILTLYGLRIDPALYRDKARYGDRYRYPVFDAPPPAEPNALYVFNAREAHLFPPERFAVTPFGGFSVAAPL